MNVRTWVMIGLALSGCASTITVRDACAEVTRAMCHRAFECLSNTGFSESDCVAGVTDCCVGSDCDKNVHSESDVDQCVSQTGLEDCSGWIAWNENPAAGLIVPGVCIGATNPD